MPSFPFTQWKMTHRNPSSTSSHSTFLSLKPTIAAIHLCRWEVTNEDHKTIVVKTREVAKLAAARHLREHQAPPRVHEYTREQLLMVQKAGQKKDNEVKQEEDNGEAKTFVKPLIHQISPEPLKRFQLAWEKAELLCELQKLQLAPFQSESR